METDEEVERDPARGWERWAVERIWTFGPWAFRYFAEKLMHAPWPSFLLRVTLSLRAAS